jgi:exonuclease VII small subunit
MKAQYITDTTGKKLSVILPIRDYEKMLHELEELEDIKAYDLAKARKSDPVSFNQAVKELEQLRKRNV